MAQPKVGLAYRQDLPPAGGYAKPPGFPVEGFRKRSPARGPAGALVIGSLALMTWGWYRLAADVDERNYYNLARFNARFERAYVLQAAEDARWLRRHKEALDSERALMSAQSPGWIVNRPRYFTQPESKPDLDTLDARKIGPW